MQIVKAIVAALAFSSSALAQFESATIDAEVYASADLYDGSGGDSQSSGGPFSGFYGGLTGSFVAYVPLGDSHAQGDAGQSTSFTPTTIVSNASVGSDVDYQGGSLSKGVASGLSTLTVRFTITEETPWTISGSVAGTHAGGSVSLYQVPPARSAPVFYFDSIGMPFFENETGMIQPGTYQFNANISAFTNANDGFGGLFAGASWDFTFSLAAPPPPFCPGDADGNGEVNFADITNVLANFGMDYSPGTGPGDADRNSVVNFADVTNVLANFGVPCP